MMYLICFLLSFVSGAFCVVSGSIISTLSDKPEEKQKNYAEAALVYLVVFVLFQIIIIYLAGMK